MKIGDDLKVNISAGQALLSGHETLKTDVEVPASTVKLLREALAEARNSDKLFQASRTKRAKTLIPALRLAQEEALVAIETAKGEIRYYEGLRWNSGWGQAGFVGSTRTPSTWAERETLLFTLATFLKDFPQYEDAEKNFTASVMLQRATALSQALLNVDVHDTKHTALAEARASAKKELSFRIGGFVRELKRLLTADDSRWKTYRLESPATERALRSDRKERAESKVQKKAAKRVQTGLEKAAKIRARMETLKLQLANLEETVAADRAKNGTATGTGTITSIAA